MNNITGKSLLNAIRQTNDLDEAVKIVQARLDKAFVRSDGLIDGKLVSHNRDGTWPVYCVKEKRMVCICMDKGYLHLYKGILSIQDEDEES